MEDTGLTREVPCTYRPLSPYDAAGGRAARLWTYRALAFSWRQIEVCVGAQFGLVRTCPPA